MELTKSSPLLARIATGALGGLALSCVLLYGRSLISSSLVSSTLLCTLSAAMLLSGRGIRYSFVSPLTILPGIYLLSLGLPSLEHACGLTREELFFKAEYVSRVDYFALGFLGLFCAGCLIADSAVLRYEAARLTRDSHSAQALTSSDSIHDRNERFIGMYHALLAVLPVTAFGLAFPLVGMEKIWVGDVARGSGQWEPWNVQTYLVQAIEACVLMSTLTAGVVRARWGSRTLWLAPVSWSALLASWGSRATLLPFMFFLLASEAAGRKLPWRKVVVVGLVTFFSMTFITNYRPTRLGLVNFFEAVSDRTGNDGAPDLLGGVSSLGPTTAVFWIAGTVNSNNVAEDVWRLVSPLPSFVLHQDIARTNILPYVGIYGGNLGAPFSVAGELFFFFGWRGMFVGFVAGLAMGWLFRKCQSARTGRASPTLLWPLMYIACVYGSIMSVHSGLRTATRMPVWALAWYLGFTALTRLLILVSRSLSGRDLPLALRGSRYRGDWLTAFKYARSSVLRKPVSNSVHGPAWPT
jgi:hypothetical protein